MNERVRTGIKIMKIVLYFAVEAKLCPNIISCPLLLMGLRMIKRVLNSI